MAGGETHAPLSSSFAATMEKQFDDFRHHLEESGSLRDRIRAVASEIESANRLMHSYLLLVHQSRPVSGICILITYCICLCLFLLFTITIPALSFLI